MLRLAPAPPGATNLRRTRPLPLPSRAAIGSDAPPASSTTTRQALVDLTRKVGALGRSGRPGEALDAVTAAARSGVRPDTRLATAVLDACAAGRRADLAASAWEALFGPAAGLAPDGRAYEALARACAAADPPAWSELGRVMSEMSSAGHALTPAVFNAALGAAARTRDLERGAAIIAQMEGAGVEPDAGTVEAVRQRRALRSLLKKAFGA